jgi:ABC-2 type transport system permease protein
MAWASPITVEHIDGIHPEALLTSSPDSWLSDSMDIMPGAQRMPSDQAEATGSYSLGVVLQGRFRSFFSDRPYPVGPDTRSLIERSPQSARIVLYSSNDFMDDQILRAQVTATGTQYLGPVELFMNTLDWALKDDELLEVRSRAHFNRTLPPMDREAQVIIEYFNYGLALAWLVLLVGVQWLRRILRGRRYANRLGL